MNDDKVFQFPTKSSEIPEQTITVTRPEFSLCKHDRITLDIHQRNVNCVDCGRVYDAFDYLHTNAVSLQRAWNDHRSVMQKVEELRISVANLTAEKKRLTATVKRLKEKVPVISTRDGSKPL